MSKLSDILRAITGAQSGVAELRAEMERLRQRQEWLIAAPFTKRDCEAMMLADLAAVQQHFLQAVKRELGEVPRLWGMRQWTKPAPLINWLALGMPTTPNRAGTPDARGAPSPAYYALAYFAAPLLRDALPRLLNDPHCPIQYAPDAECGPPLAERERELADIAKRLSKLEAEEAELVAALDQAHTASGRPPSLKEVRGVMDRYRAATGGFAGGVPAMVTQALGMGGGERFDRDPSLPAAPIDGKATRVVPEHKAASE